MKVPPAPVQPPAGEPDADGRGIREILEKRRRSAQPLREVNEQLEALRTGLAELRGRAAEAAPLVPGVDAAALDQAAAAVQALHAALRPLEKRLTRDTLNVVVVGLARSGKSTLLRSLSGLDTSIIPDYDTLLPCTGARSVVRHRAGPGATRGELVGARVRYHDEAGLMELIGNYWSQLGLEAGYGPAPTRLDAFLKTRLPARYEQVKGAGDANRALHERYYEELKKYHDRLNADAELRAKVRPGEPLTEPIAGRDRVARYVTQVRRDGTQPESWEHLVVDEVVLECDFLKHDVADVALIDLPGLGEAKLGVAERMVRTLANEADVALYILYPTDKDHPDQTDFFTVYDVCNRALGRYIPLHEWAFLVLNRVADSSTARAPNGERCRDYLAHLKPEQRARFVDTVICDCSGEHDVREVVLAPVLRHLAVRIVELDAQFARRFAREAAEAHATVQRLLAPHAGGGDPAQAVPAESLDFREHFNQAWKELNRALNSLVEDLDYASATVDTPFQHEVEAVLAAYHPPLPDAQAFTRARLAESGAPNLRGAFARCVNELRADMARHLMQLDPMLDRTLQGVKDAVAERFRRDGRLAALMEGEGGPLLSLADRLPRDPRYEEIRAAFRKLHEFRMSARGVIGFKVRKALQRLEPDLLAEVAGGVTGSGEAVAALRALADGALREIHETLSDEEFRRPNECAYAIAADVRDAVLAGPDAADRWAAVYEAERLQVWPEVYGDLERRRRVRAEWGSAAGRTLDASARLQEALRRLGGAPAAAAAAGG
ncbi:MAG TPA: hypothetical protein VFJ82_14260 [Longimicrobium sp.]|nr:hypothetical protein [Longimicrobium sp.]